MVGVGRTVFEGTELKDFKVHILGVLRNVQGPRRDLILARLEGGRLAETGVVAGMSGSPVYIDGRLDRRGVVFHRRVLEGTDRRHHADRRDEGRDRAAPPRAARGRRGSSCRSRAKASSAALAAVYALDWRRLPPPGRRAVDRHRRRPPAASSARCCGRSPRRSSWRLRAGDRRSHLGSLPRCGLHADGRRDRGRQRRRRVTDGPLREGDAIGVALARRRHRDGRDRHGHAHRRRPRLRVRPSLLQPRPDRVPDDARLRLHDRCRAC